MSRLHAEVEVFRRWPRSMRVLMVSKMVYALVLRVIEIFVAAQIGRELEAEGGGGLGLREQTVAREAS
jgi:hypothetical protein